MKSDLDLPIKCKDCSDLFLCPYTNKYACPKLKFESERTLIGGE